MEEKKKKKKKNGQDAAGQGRSRSVSPAERSPAHGSSRAPFPIIGIGASAGGLEALERFFSNVPRDTGMAYVVVQHLDPTHKGNMPELLQRITPMPVLQVKDRTRVQPDHVYVIPPNKDMSLLHGVLHLLAPAAPRGLRLPIDFFFRSLASDRRERGAGVVLSGMGTDGTLGLKSIKENEGLVLAQEPGSAKFDGMPRSAIEAGLTDLVATPEELPRKLLSYFQHSALLAHPAAPLEERAQSALEKIVLLIRTHTGHDFSFYKKSTVYRRIERRMGIHQIAGIDAYVQYLRRNPNELDILFKELMIGVTSFFRDPEAWERLGRLGLPELLANRPAGSVLRAWSAGCSTGEEAYSLAIAFKEALQRVKPEANLTLQIFATDLDQEAIDKARQGVYPTNIGADVSPERLSRFFVKQENGYRISKDIREMVVFAQQNLIMDPPFTKLDVLICRNLLIYLSPEMQRKLMPLFHYSLNPGGLLFLGSAETVGGFTEFFDTLESKARIYRRRPSPVRTELVEFPTSFSPAPPEAALKAEPAKPAPNLQSLADQVLLQKFSPAAVLVGPKGDIVYISGRTGKFLEPAAGKANWNIFAMAREELRFELSAAFKKALRQEGPVTVSNLQVPGGSRPVNLTVQAVQDPPALQGMVMIVFSESPASPGRKAPPQPAADRAAQLTEMQRELHRIREELQTTREEMQTSQEELKSANEEMQSTNEELQSTNEELTTSKEELQSLNEELQTVNAEMQVKLDELGRANNDMKNLLNSTDVATVFLDGELRIRRFTPQATKVINLIHGDIGRPLLDISSELLYAGLAEDAREVLRTLLFSERQVSCKGGRWYQVRIIPYRTQDNKIDGVVLTFIDITAPKSLEADLKRSEAQLRDLLGSLPVLVWTCLPDGACDFCGRQWTEFSGAPEADLLGYGWLKLVHPGDRGRVKSDWGSAVAAGEPFEAEFRLRSKDGSCRRFQSRVAPARDAQGRLTRWYGYAVDVGPAENGAEGSKA